MIDLSTELAAAKKKATRKKAPAKKTPRKKAAKKRVSAATKKKESDALKKVRKTGIKKDGTKAKYKKAPKKKAKIKDTGEKIGGARKDRSAKKAPIEKPKVKDDTPAWRKRYVVREIDEKTYKNGTWVSEKRWQTYDTRSGRKGSGGKAIGRSWETQGQAYKAAAAVAAGAAHRIRASTASGTDTYTIERVLGRNQYERASDTTFKSYQEALKFLVENAEALLDRKPETKRKTGHGEEMLATPSKVVRVGPKWRKTDAEPEQFIKKFHARGVEFGNWQGNRQTVLNNAFDALSDMADILKVAPESLFFNKKLGLAFGARGRGGKGGARAHYEPDYLVMNLTKKQGAGSLAHEWWHAVDHMLGQAAYAANRETTTTPDGHTVMTRTDSHQVMGSHIVSKLGRGEMPETVATAYRSLMQEMFDNKTSVSVPPAEIDDMVKKANEDFDHSVNRLRTVLENEQPIAKRFKKAASPAQLREFDEHVRALAKNPSDLSASSALRTLSKKMRGANGGYYAALIVREANLRHSTHQRAEKLRTEPSVRSKTTEFFKNASALDRGRTKTYWTLHHELAARAFSAYVEDKLAEKKRRSDYLSFGSNGNHYSSAPANPFPEGDERKKINAKFDELLDAMRKSGFMKQAKGKKK